MGKIFIRTCIILVALLLSTACGKEDPIKEINEHLEATVNIEAEFEATQAKITDLEKEDQKLYEEIISLGSEDADKVAELSDEATELLEMRATYAKEEKENMRASQDEFEKLKPLQEKMVDSKKKDRVFELYETMIERYELYDKVYETYLVSIEETEGLYKAFKSEGASEKSLYKAIEAVNKSYDEVTDIYEDFNAKTNDFNELKKGYYDTDD